MTRTGGHQRRTLALVPLRDPGVGKSRLAHRLDHEQRRHLALSMAADVVACLRVSAVDEILLVAAGPGAADAAGRLDVPCLRDVPGTRHLDDALTTATAGSTADVLVVMADLPRLRPSEVDLVLASEEEVVVVPSRDGGTGGLLQRTGAPARFAFGPGSATRHLAEGRRRGRTARLLRSPGFAHDVDTWEDLSDLHGCPHVGTATARWLQGLGDGLGDPVSGQTSPEKSWSSMSSLMSAR